MKQPFVNITPPERIGRAILGTLGVVFGLAFLAGAPTVFFATLDVLLALAGLDLVVTGVLGHCPLYAKLGYVPRSLRGTA